MKQFLLDRMIAYDHFRNLHCMRVGRLSSAVLSIPILEKGGGFQIQAALSTQGKLGHIIKTKGKEIHYELEPGIQHHIPEKTKKWGAIDGKDRRGQGDHNKYKDYHQIS